METGGKALPGHLAQAGIQSADQPDLSGHGADGRGPVFEEIKAADEEQSAVRIIKRNLDGIHGERLAIADGSLGLQLTRPTGRPTVCQRLKLGLIFFPRGDQPTLSVALIRKDDLIPVTIEPEIAVAGLRRHRLLGEGDLACDGRTGRHAMPSFAELDEATLPSERERKADRIKAGGLFTLLHGDAFRHHHGAASEYAAEQDAFVREIPATVFPRDGIVLIPPVPLPAAV